MRIIGARELYERKRGAVLIYKRFFLFERTAEVLQHEGHNNETNRAEADYCDGLIDIEVLVEELFGKVKEKALFLSRHKFRSESEGIRLRDSSKSKRLHNENSREANGSDKLWWSAVVELKIA